MEAVELARPQGFCRAGSEQAVKAQSEDFFSLSLLCLFLLSCLMSNLLTISTGHSNRSKLSFLCSQGSAEE